MGTILAASLQGRRRGRGFMNETQESDGKACRVLAALFLCTFGLTAYYCTEPETFWLRVVRVGILVITGTSALIILIPFQMIEATVKRIKCPDFISKYKFPPLEKLAIPFTSNIEKCKNPATIEMPTKIDSNSECKLRSPLGSPLQPSLQSYENISTVS